MSRLTIYRQEVQRAPVPQPKGILARLADFFRSSTQPPLTLKDPELARRLGLNGGATGAGVVVNETTALNYSAVWAAVSLISSQIASLPLILYKRETNGGKQRFTGHQTYRLLHDEFNPEMTSMVGRETMQAHCLTWGNAFAEIERDMLGRPIALWPLLPYQVTPFRDEAKRLQYLISTPGLPNAVIPAADMLHIPGLGFDGLMGYSPIHMAKESLALGMAAQKFGATFYGNGASFGGTVEFPEEIGPDAVSNFLESVEAKYQGPQRAHRLLVLEGGAKYNKIGVDPNAAQFLETRQFEVSEVARWFNIPPHKLRDLMRATFSNIEQQSIEFVTDTLRPWMVRWEQECNRKLVSRPERNIQYVEHLVEGLLRGDIASRYSAYAVGRQWGWLCADDIRGLENMNPLPNGQGQIYLVPQNMAPADRIHEVIDAQVARSQQPALPPAPDDDGEDDDRHAELLTEIREQRSQWGLLSAAVASKEAELKTLAEQRQRDAEEHARILADLRTAHGETREALLKEQAAVAERTAQLTETEQHAAAALERWQTERSAIEQTLGQREQELLELRAEHSKARAEAERSAQERQATEAQLRQESAQALEQARSEAEARVATLTTQLDDARAQLASVESERTAAQAARDAALADADRRVADTEALRAAHAEELRTEVEALAAAADEARAQQAALQASQREAEAAHATALSAAQSEAERRVAELETALRSAHAAELQVKVDEFSALQAEAQAQVQRSESERAELLAAHEGALADAQARANQQLADVEAAIKAAHEAALREQAVGIHREATEAHATLVAEHGAKVSEIVRAHAAEAKALRAQHAEALVAESSRVTELRETLAAAHAALEQAQATVAANAALVERADRERAAAIEAQQAAEARALAEAEARTQAEARASRRGDHAAVLSAHRSLAADTMRRMIEREADRVRRSQATPQKLRAWVDTFYTGHEDLCRNALLPVVRVHLAFMRSEQDAPRFAGDLARQHVEESLRDLRVVLDEPDEEFHQALAGMLHRWEHERTTVIADQLMEKELDYVRRAA